MSSGLDLSENDESIPLIEWSLGQHGFYMLLVFYMVFYAADGILAMVGKQERLV